MSGGGTGETQGGAQKGERIAKVIARSGLCSRRDAERLIAEGRVAVNRATLSSPAVTVGPDDRIEVDGAVIQSRERTRLWLFNKPKGLVTTNRDPEGRRTVFSALPPDMPRVLSVGRLDINTEGLLLLTNDGGLARVLELPSTGWLRRYRVRAHGRVDQHALDALRGGVTIDGMIYGAVEAEIDRVQGTNVWLIVGLREGKNREVKRVLEHLGLPVNRLIRISYGPFQLGDLEEGEVREVRGRVLRDQLGEKLAHASGADFEAPIRQRDPQAVDKSPTRRRGAEENRSGRGAGDKRPGRGAEAKRLGRGADGGGVSRGSEAKSSKRAGERQHRPREAGKDRAATARPYPERQARGERPPDAARPDKARPKRTPARPDEPASRSPRRKPHADRRRTP